ncbi:TagK domain-containing protein [Pseudomonas cerasi]
MTWPDRDYRFNLDESYTSDTKVGFSVLTGEFSDQHPDQQEENLVYFYWTLAGAVIFNRCIDYVCIIDGVPVEKDDTCTLNAGAEIQIGHYAIQAVASDNMFSLEDMFYTLHGYEANKSDIIIPEIEDILPNGAHFVGDLNYSNEILSDKITETDAIKPLETEYKKFLIWGHVNNNLYDKKADISRHVITKDDLFDSAHSEMQSKTIMECILDAPSLIDKVWDDLEVINLQDSVFYEEEKYEILMLLAPEKFTAKEKKVIPELAFQDLYKIGLDSHY